MKKIIVLISCVATMSIDCLAGGGSYNKSVEPAITVPAMIPGEIDDSGVYVGVALAVQRTYGDNSDWFSDDVLAQDKTIPLIGVLGYNFNKYIAVEGRIGQSMFEEDYADVFTYSLFLKPQYPVTENISIYGLVGYGNVEVDGADGDEPAFKKDGQNIIDHNGFQWGFGASYRLTDKFLVFADYTLLMDEESIPLQPLYEYEFRGIWNDQLSNDLITFGVNYQF